MNKTEVDIKAVVAAMRLETRARLSALREEREAARAAIAARRIAAANGEPRWIPERARSSAAVDTTVPASPTLVDNPVPTTDPLSADLETLPVVEGRLSIADEPILDTPEPPPQAPDAAAFAAEDVASTEVSPEHEGTVAKATAPMIAGPVDAGGDHATGVQISSTAPEVAAVDDGFDPFEGDADTPDIEQAAQATSAATPAPLLAGSETGIDDGMVTAACPGALDVALDVALEKGLTTALFMEETDEGDQAAEAPAEIGPSAPIEAGDTSIEPAPVALDEEVGETISASDPEIINAPIEAEAPDADAMAEADAEIPVAVEPEVAASLEAATATLVEIPDAVEAPATNEATPEPEPFIADAWSVGEPAGSPENEPVAARESRRFVKLRITAAISAATASLDGTRQPEPSLADAAPEASAPSGPEAVFGNAPVTDRPDKAAADTIQAEVETTAPITHGPDEAEPEPCPVEADTAVPAAFNADAMDPALTIAQDIEPGVEDVLTVPSEPHEAELALVLDDPPAGEELAIDGSTPAAEVPLEAIAMLGPALIRRLMALGYRDAATLAGADIGELSEGLGVLGEIINIRTLVDAAAQSLREAA